MLQYVERFQDLEVYKAARQLSKEIFTLSKSFPKEEMYSLTDQIRRASRSIGGQIAEAWGKRNYVKHFVSKLTDSDGEQLETQHWLGTAMDCNYITDEEATYFFQKCQSIGKMLGSMINNPDSFCKK